MGKKDICPSNVTICKDNCYYDGINWEEEIIILLLFFLDNINYNIFNNKLLYDFYNLKSNF